MERIGDFELPKIELGPWARPAAALLFLRVALDFIWTSGAANAPTDFVERWRHSVGQFPIWMQIVGAVFLLLNLLEVGKGAWWVSRAGLKREGE